MTIKAQFPGEQSIDGAFTRQPDARGESTLMKSADSIKNAQQNLTKMDNARITTGQGANQLPTVQGPQITIAPPVTSATKIADDRKIE